MSPGLPCPAGRAEFYKRCEVMVEGLKEVQDKHGNGYLGEARVLPSYGWGWGRRWAQTVSRWRTWDGRGVWRRRSPPPLPPPRALSLLLTPRARCGAGCGTLRKVPSQSARSPGLANFRDQPCLPLPAPPPPASRLPRKLLRPAGVAADGLGPLLRGKWLPRLRPGPRLACTAAWQAQHGQAPGTRGAPQNSTCLHRPSAPALLAGSCSLCRRTGGPIRSTWGPVRNPG